jgi:hypothetical protein
MFFIIHLNRQTQRMAGKDGDKGEAAKLQKDRPSYYGE